MSKQSIMRSICTSAWGALACASCVAACGDAHGRDDTGAPTDENGTLEIALRGGVTPDWGGKPSNSDDDETMPSASADDSSGNDGTSTSDSETPLLSSEFAMNFKPPDAPDVQGYLQDSGDVYGIRSTGHAYGWNVSHRDEGYYNELLSGYGWLYAHWSYIETLPDAKWEIDVPNGEYTVLVQSAGCDTDKIGVTQKIVVEGVLILNKTPYIGCYDAYDMYDEGVVTVADGKLTVTNGDDTSRNFIAYMRVKPN